MTSNTFIYVLKLQPCYTRKANWTPETKKVISKHFSYLKALQEKGVVLLAGKTDYEVDNLNNYGIVLLRTKDAIAANKIMNNDPAIEQKVMFGEFHPFSISLIIKDKT